MNSRIINALRKKNWLLKSKFDSMKKKGGASVRRLLDQWKSTTYAFTVYYQELDKASLLQENKEVRGQKRVLGENVVNEVAKRLKVEENSNKLLPNQKNLVVFTRRDLRIWPERLPG